MKHVLAVLLLSLALGAGSGCKKEENPQGLAVVDIQKVLSESKPAKAAEEHLKKVQAVLQKGLADLQKVYQGVPNTAENRKGFIDGQQALERQMVIEQQAIANLLNEALNESVGAWTGKDKYAAVLPRGILLHSANHVDVTNNVMEEMDKKTLEFPPLPTVTVTPPTKPAVKPATPPEAKPTNKQQKKR